MKISKSFTSCIAVLSLLLAGSFFVLPDQSTAGENWVKCADENGVCKFNGTKQVRYGKNDKWAMRQFTNSVPCNNNVFGDPVYGTVKECQVLEVADTDRPVKPGNWIKCADENGVCKFNGTKQVRYGKNDKWAMRQFTNSTPCNNNVFGDPIYGTVKECQFLEMTAVPKPGNWVKCADENGVCKFNGTKQVRYGKNDKWVIKQFTNSVPCNNNIFGDPVYGTVKECQVLN